MVSGIKLADVLLHCLLVQQPKVDQVCLDKSNERHERLYPHQDVHQSLAALVSWYPIQAVLPPSAVPLLRSLLDMSRQARDAAQALVDLRVLSPLTYRLLVLDVRDAILAQGFRALLLRLCDLSLKPFSGRAAMHISYPFAIVLFYPHDHTA